MIIEVSVQVDQKRMHRQIDFEDTLGMESIERRRRSKQSVARRPCSSTFSRISAIVSEGVRPSCPSDPSPSR